jgi:tetratricopeptide (TPR) repeat protein
MQKPKHNTSIKVNPKKPVIVSNDKLNGKWIAIIIAMLVATYIVYTPALKNTLTGWDDKNYITIDKDIQKLDAAHIAKIFALKTACIMGMGNYHPLTMLSYAIEYSYDKLNPRVYHTTNIILHLINTLLVFLFIRLLARSNIIAFITALLFAIHTMHVESVAWVAERKDLLYVLFEIAALFAYTWYIRNTQKRKMFYLLAIILFACSILSKAMAVSMAVILPLIDYYSGRKLIDKKVILEKIPFFLIALIFGILAYTAQKQTKAIVFTDYSLYDRILFAAYGVTTYLWKSQLPINLSCFYDYPLKGTYGWYIVYAIIVLALCWLVYKSVKHTRIILFGMLFFIFSLVMILQIIPVGGAIIADRYTYIAYIGLFFMIGHGIDYVWKNKTPKFKILKPALTIILSVFILCLAIGTYQRCKVWKDTLSIWNDALEKYPSTIKGYNGRGDAYNEKHQYKLAIKDFDKALEMKVDYSDAYYNRGLAYYWLGKEAQDAGKTATALPLYYKAISDDSLAIKYSPDLACAYFNRSGNYYTIGKFKPALEDALKAKELGYEVDSLYVKALKRNIK